MGEKMASIDYITENFLTLEKLATLSKVPVEQLREMMAANCLPGPAYEVTGHYTVRSIFGEHQETVCRAYYPKSHVVKAQAIAANSDGYSKQNAALRQAFYRDYKKILVTKKAVDFGLEHLFDEAGQVKGDAADKLLASEWQHYLDGTYGLCTRGASVEEIAMKETMIAKIIYLTDLLDQEKSQSLVDDLRCAVDALDAVSAPFGPHEVASSSRGRYIDAVREKYFET